MKTTTKTHKTKQIEQIVCILSPVLFFVVVIVVFSPVPLCGAISLFLNVCCCFFVVVCSRFVFSLLRTTEIDSMSAHSWLRVNFCHSTLPFCNSHHITDDDGAHSRNQIKCKQIFELVKYRFRDRDIHICHTATHLA